MRRYLCGALLLFHANGDALATSLAPLPGTMPGAAPSVIVLGTPEAAMIDAAPVVAGGRREETQANLYVVSPSVVAFGAEAIPTAREAVSSIGGKGDAKPHWRHEAAPLVIRGGTVGDAFATSSAAVAPAPSAPSQPLEAAAPPPPADSQPRTEPVAPSAPVHAAPAPPTQLPE